MFLVSHLSFFLTRPNSRLNMINVNLGFTDIDTELIGFSMQILHS